MIVQYIKNLWLSLKTKVYHCQSGMCEASEEKERKDRTVEDEVSIAQEAGAEGASSEALKDKIDVKDYVTINGFVLNSSIDHLPNRSSTMA